jgi:hypothetical protein
MRWLVTVLLGMAGCAGESSDSAGEAATGSVEGGTTNAAAESGSGSGSGASDATPVESGSGSGAGDATVADAESGSGSGRAESDTTVADDATSSSSAGQTCEQAGGVCTCVGACPSAPLDPGLDASCPQPADEAGACSMMCCTRWDCPDPACADT